MSGNAQPRLLARELAILARESEAVEDDADRVSFFSRPTPHVPIVTLPQSGAATAKSGLRPRVAPPALPNLAEEEPDRPSVPRISQAFWDSAPVYSEPPSATGATPTSAVEFTPTVKRSRRLRRALAFLLFLVLFTPALMLFAHVLAVLYGFSWHDVGMRAAEFFGSIELPERARDLLLP